MDNLQNWQKNTDVSTLDKHLTKNFEVESVEYENTYEIHQDVDSGRAGRVAADPQKR